MKKIMLGLVAAFALSTFAAPAFAGEEAPAGDAAAKPEKSAKKGKKSKKAKEGEAPAADAPAGAEKTK